MSAAPSPALVPPSQEQSLRIGWDEVRQHVALSELMRVEGADLAGRPFWMILQMTEAHRLNLVAYRCQEVMGRTQPGSMGIITLKSGEWGDFRTDTRSDGTIRFLCGVAPQEPIWPPGPDLKIAIGNTVNYVSGNALVLKAVASQLTCRFIKGWDLPVEFSMSTGVASTAVEAASADASVSARHAQNSGQAGHAVVASESFASDSVRPLPIGEVLMLTTDNPMLDLPMEGPISVRVFLPDGESKQPGGEADSLAAIARMESLMHLRVRSMPRTSAERPGLLAVYFDVASNSVRMENLSERNVIGAVAFGKDRLVDVVRLNETPTPPSTSGRRVLRITNLGKNKNVVVAVWRSDPVLPTLKQGQFMGKGRYTLDRQLGAGGMGVVWLAFDEQLREAVALKFLSPDIRGDPEAQEALRRETLRCRKLSHPNIIRIHDIHQVEGEIPFISMEYVDGSTLLGLRQRRPKGALAWAHIEPMVEQLCLALDYSHAQGVIHRDLKPSNLMLTTKGQIKLSDFGIAAVVNDSVSRTNPAARTCGTLNYMSPQQLQGQVVKPTDDVYALGSTLYELLTSKPPFYTGDVAWQVVSVEPTDIYARMVELGVKEELPPTVAALIMACLRKNPDERPQTAQQVFAMLRGHMPLPGSGVQAVNGTISDPQGQSKAGSRLTQFLTKLTKKR